MQNARVSIYSLIGGTVLRGRGWGRGGGFKQRGSLGRQLRHRELGGQAGNDELAFVFGRLSKAAHVTFMLFHLHVPATQVKGKKAREKLEAASATHQPELTSFVVPAAIAFAL